MANYLDANPDEAERVRSSAAYTGLAPLVRHGEVIAYVAPRLMPKPTLPLSAEDYVVGLETLGFRFEVHRLTDGRTGIYTLNPEAETPPGWHGVSIAIMNAFDSRERHDELAAFLLARDGEVR